MNPVSSYQDFMEFLQYSSENRDKLIPVIIIKPSVMLYINRDSLLNHIFDYFDRRTGDGIQFFLPGYAHYPNTSFEHILANVRPYNADSIALTTGRLGNIYYSDKAFVEFIDELENHLNKFMYRGDTELLFLKYITGGQYKIGNFDFSKTNRYNLSKIYYSQRYRDLSEYERLRIVEHFLEDVILAIHRADGDEKMIASIDDRYNFMV